LRLLIVFAWVRFWYTRQLCYQHTLRLYISHGTESIMIHRKLIRRRLARASYHSHGRPEHVTENMAGMRQTTSATISVRLKRSSSPGEGEPSRMNKVEELTAEVILTPVHSRDVILSSAKAMAINGRSRERMPCVLGV
jgi:hypothetical protein